MTAQTKAQSTNPRPTTEQRSPLRTAEVSAANPSGSAQSTTTIRGVVDGKYVNGSAITASPALTANATMSSNFSGWRVSATSASSTRTLTPTIVTVSNRLGGDSEQTRSDAVRAPPANRRGSHRSNS